MTDLELVNEFINREDLTGTDAVLKQKCLELDARLNSAQGELKELTEARAVKQGEVLSLSQQLEGLLQVILELVKGGVESTDLAPILQEPVETVETEDSGE